jgi:glycosyltransferase involved in cell wall biosynthesis
MAYDWLPTWRRVVQEAAKVNMHRPAVSARLSADPTIPVVLCVLKNECSLLPDFFAHYRLLGIERFIMIDNGSTDGSYEYCAAQPDTDLHLVERPFSWPEKQGWISRAIAENGLDRWYIYADADERMVFSGAPRHSFGELAALASRKGVRRVRGMLIDMYANGPILDFSWPDKLSLADAFPLFDTDGYVEESFEKLVSRKGGPRPRVMGDGNKKFNPELTKYPLFRPRPGDLMCNPHYIEPAEKNFDSDCFIGILHYKFLPGFINKVRKAVLEGNYWDNSSEYQIYLNTLTKDPSMSFVYAGSARYTDPADLVMHDLITGLDWDDLVSSDYCLIQREARKEMLSQQSVINAKV